MTTPWWAWAIMSMCLGLQADNEHRVWAMVALRLVAAGMAVVALIILLTRGA